jgi:hypothetical protein
MMSLTAAEPTRSAWNTPPGTPASAKSASIASAEPHTLEACFRTHTFPARSAGIANRKTCQNGKFHGMTPSTTPSGSNAT